MNAEGSEEYEIPSAEELIGRPKEDYTCIPLPSRQKAVEKFIQLAQEVSELYRRYTDYKAQESCFCGVWLLYGAGDALPFGRNKVGGRHRLFSQHQGI